MELVHVPWKELFEVKVQQRNQDDSTALETLRKRRNRKQRKRHLEKKKRYLQKYKNRFESVTKEQVHDKFNL